MRDFRALRAVPDQNCVEYVKRASIALLGAQLQTKLPPFVIIITSSVAPSSDFHPGLFTADMTSDCGKAMYHAEWHANCKSM